jgi:hypothetical protein
MNKYWTYYYDIGHVGLTYFYFYYNY